MSLNDEMHSVEEQLDTALELFMELASDNLPEQEIVRFNQEFNDRGLLAETDPADDWAADVGFEVSDADYAGDPGAVVATPESVPSSTMVRASSVASARRFMKAPEPTLTSSTSDPVPSAIFLLMMELAMSGIASTVPVTSRRA